MKRLIACLLILLLPMIAFAAQIFGNLKYGDRSVGEGIEILIRCDGERDEWRTRTDAYGSYSVYLPRPRKCRLQVYFANQWSEPSDVYPDQTDPVRYDFELMRRNDGTIYLVRK